MSEVKRDVLRRLLARWQSGELNERTVHQEAEVLWEANDSWPECEDTDPRSIGIEALSHLDILNHQLITREDIPAFLHFLEAPEGHESDAWREWRKYWETVDFDARKCELADNAYYIT